MKLNYPGCVRKLNNKEASNVSAKCAWSTLNVSTFVWFFLQACTPIELFCTEIVQLFVYVFPDSKDSIFRTNFVTDLIGIILLSSETLLKLS